MKPRRISHQAFKPLWGSAFFALLFILSLIALPSEAATLKAEEISDLYSQAKNLFREANETAAASPEQAAELYEKAALRYERVIRKGKIRNGKLYYNLGNIYFRMKDIGRAIVNYRKAEEYLPNDPNLKQNLAYARKLRLDEIEENQETKVLKTLFFWHYDLSTKSRLILFTGCLGLLWGFAGIRIFKKNSFINWGIVSAALLCVSLASSLAADEMTLRNNRPGVIVAQEVVARKGNSETYEPSFKEPLHSGTEFLLVEERDEWVRIELPDARTCWVRLKDVELVR